MGFYRLGAERVQCIYLDELGRAFDTAIMQIAGKFNIQREKEIQGLSNPISESLFLHT